MKSLVRVLPFLLACSQDQPTCTADKNGFGGAPTVKLTSLSATIPPAGNPCRARLDVLRSAAELASAYADVGLANPPAVDFVNDVVIVRVGTDPASVVWSVQDKSGIVLGLQGCQEPTESACSVSFYSAPSPVTAVDSRTCDSVHCGFSSGGN